MEDHLTSDLPIRVEGIDALARDAAFPNRLPNPLADDGHPSPGFLGNVRKIDEVFPREDDDVAKGHRPDVHDRQNTLILMHEAQGQTAGNDLTEYTLR